VADPTPDSADPTTSVAAPERSADEQWLAEGEVAAAADLDAGYDDGYTDGYDDGYDDLGVYEDDEDYVYVPEDRGLVRKFMAVVACIVLFLFLVIGLGGYLLYSQVYPSSESTDAVVLVIPKDAGLATISRLLEEKEVISNATIFRYYAKWKNIPSIRAGEYDKLYKNDSMDHVIERLKQGPLPPKFTEILLPEGLWLVDTIAKIKEKYPDMSDDAAYQAAALSLKSKYRPDGKPLDGLLFPAGYRVEDDDKADPGQLLDQMVKKFEQVGDEIGLNDAATKLDGAAGKTSIGPYEALTVASLIEGEAKAPEDRARIARVIYNRLKSDQRLDIDATVPSALASTSRSSPRPTSRWTRRSTPARTGLPPTPSTRRARSPWSPRSTCPTSPAPTSGSTTCSSTKRATTSPATTTSS
jgi:UPF0755 protein